MLFFLCNYGQDDQIELAKREMLTFIISALCGARTIKLTILWIAILQHEKSASFPYMKTEWESWTLPEIESRYICGNDARAQILNGIAQSHIQKRPASAFLSN